MTADPRRGNVRWSHHGNGELTAWRMKSSCARMLTARVVCPRHHRNCTTPTFYAQTANRPGARAGVGDLA